MAVATEAAAQTVPRVSWRAFRERLTCRQGCRPPNDIDGECPAWHQGEHVSLIGPTHSGKTTLATELLDLRDYVVVMGTKVRDSNLERLTRAPYKFKRIKRWPPPWGVKRVLLWPVIRTRSDLAPSLAVIGEALDDIFVSGGWCVVIDEAGLLCRKGYAGPLEDNWTQGRTLGISQVAATQRPAFVPLYMYDQPTHLFFWTDNDETNLRRVGGLGGLSASTVRRQVAQLAKHDVLYVNTRTKELLVTRVER